MGVISVLMDIVPVGVPALLDAEQLYADNVTNRLVHRAVLPSKNEPLKYRYRRQAPIVRHRRHLYALMRFPSSIIYTTDELQKMHRQFLHPSAGKLYNLLKKAGLEAVDIEPHKHLEEFVARCEPCQLIHNAPVRF